MMFTSAAQLTSLLEEGGAEAATAGRFDVTEMVNGIAGALIYVTIGMLAFVVAFWLITKITPFSIRKEIEEDQNTALGVVIGAVLIGLAIIIAAAIS